VAQGNNPRCITLSKTDASFRKPENCRFREVLAWFYRDFHCLFDRQCRCRASVLQVTDQRFGSVMDDSGKGLPDGLPPRQRSAASRQSCSALPLKHPINTGVNAPGKAAMGLKDA
jgi:hypothetical protein